MRSYYRTCRPGTVTTAFGWTETAIFLLVDKATTSVPDDGLIQEFSKLLL